MKSKYVVSAILCTAVAVAHYFFVEPQAARWLLNRQYNVAEHSEKCVRALRYALSSDPYVRVEVTQRGVDLLYGVSVVANVTYGESEGAAIKGESFCGYSEQANCIYLLYAPLWGPDQEYDRQRMLNMALSNNDITILACMFKQLEEARTRDSRH